MFNDSDKRMKILTLVLIAGILLGWLFTDTFLRKDENKTGTVFVEKKYIDTVVKLIPQKPLIITKQAVKTIVRTDTIIKSEPFIARLDTVLTSDTVNLRYDFPENIFKFELKRKPDSLKIQTITLTYPVEKKQPWWETPAYIVGGILVGCVIGSVTK